MPSRSAATRRPVPRLVNLLAILLIRGYQRMLAPRLARQGFRCAHYPTCSEYGVLAFRKYGFLTASRVTLDRIRGCGDEAARPLVDFP